jgi:chromosome segregation ATPase
MALFTEKRTPYEFLVRWDVNGVIQGAHIGFLDTVLKDGEVLTQIPSNVESVAVGVQNGFPLDDVLDKALSDALTKIDLLEEANSEVIAEKIELAGRIADLVLELEAVRAENAKLQESINQLQADPA